MIDIKQALEMVKRGMIVNIQNIDDGTLEQLVKDHCCNVIRDSNDVFVAHSDRDGIIDLVKKVKPILLDIVNCAGIISGPHHAAYLFKPVGEINEPLIYGVSTFHQALSELSAEGEIFKCAGNDDGMGAYCSKSYTGDVKSKIQLELDDKTFGAAAGTSEKLPKIYSLLENIGGNIDVVKAIHALGAPEIDRYILLAMLINSNK